MDAARPPAPARDTGLPPGVLVGSLGRRFVAYLVDFLVPGVAASTITGALSGTRTSSSIAVTVVALVVALAWAVVCWQQLAVKAASPGMRLMKLQLVGFLDGRPVGWGRVLLRFVVFLLLSATALGLLLLLVALLVNPRHQGWHDRAAGAVVIARRPLAPPRPAVRTAQTGTAPPARPPAARPAAPAPGPAPVAAPLAGDPALPPEPVPVPVATSASTRTNGQRTHRRIVEGWVAELDDGREIPVHGLVLIGRNPQPGEGEEDAALVKVPDESRTVSKTHLAIGVDDAGLFVVDRGSTNGSTVTAPERPSFKVGAFQAVPVTEGSVVSIGDHWLRIHRTHQRG